MISKQSELQKLVRTKWKIIEEPYPPESKTAMVLKTMKRLGYDNNIDNLENCIKPYDSQLELMRYVTDLNNEELFIIYKAMTGSGKTTTAILLANYIMRIRSLEYTTNNNQSLQLLFVCSSDFVRCNVAKLAFSSGIPLGILVMENNILKIIDNYNCVKPENRILLIADPESAKEILKYPNSNTNYILFLDEPMINADQPNSEFTNIICKILFNAPKKTVLCTSMFPDLMNIPNIINHLNNMYLNLNIKLIESNNSFNNREIISFSGDMLINKHNHKIQYNENIIFTSTRCLFITNNPYDTAIRIGNDLITTYLDELKRFKPTITFMDYLKYIKAEYSQFETLNVFDEILILLKHGIGIYDPQNGNLNDAYNDLILKLLNEEKLNCVISNENIFFGLNFLFSCVIIEDNIANNHSINTILVLIEKANANDTTNTVFVGLHTYERLCNFINGDTVDLNIEAQNMNDVFKNVQQNPDSELHEIQINNVTIRHDGKFMESTTIQLSNLKNRYKT